MVIIPMSNPPRLRFGDSEGLPYGRVAHGFPVCGTYTCVGHCKYFDGFHSPFHRVSHADIHNPAILTHHVENRGDERFCETEG